ncbi:MAG TPA: BBP7 family outer membrane beta-barrel protein [Gemmataceae bacterium]|nr:BBP7 family outer membrane beta-barrel protein [Gemmataceae bacterium]
MLKRLAPAVVTALAIATPALAQEPTTPSAPTSVADGGTATTQSTPDTAAAAPVVSGDGAVVAPPVEVGPVALHRKGSQYWFDADFLLGFVRGDPLPPLVTTSPAGTPRINAGILGQAGTTVLVGNQNANTGARYGFRIDAGYWCTCEQLLGLEADFFLVGGTTKTFSFTSTGTPILARPFLDVTTGLQSAALVAFPGVSSGSIQVQDHAHDFWGYDIDLRENMWHGPGYRFDSLFGYRYLRYDEQLTITQNTQPTDGVFATGTNVAVVDNFVTHNVFNGADLGMRAEFYNDAWSLGLLAKVGVGVTEHTVNINGSTVTTAPGAAPVINGGGLLALSSNIGSKTAYDYSAVPELGVTLGWQVTPNMRLTLGYDVLWWFNVARPGEQINLNVNPGLIEPATSTTPATPTRTGQKDNVWLQALNVGMEFRF